MPYKSLSSPRQVVDVTAELRASAVLASPSLVAMLSTDPVRLAMQPAAGGTGKVTPVALDAADEVAMLSRDVAVVRSGDDVWALLDLAHTAKIEQVARDARAIRGRPSGEAALVLGWDGGATALTLGKHEVNARPFALRGTVRAFDLEGNETFVVVDGAGGGELRIHPGATPEPAATGRVALPAGAAELDRVRAGGPLSVVFKPGRREVCVVQQTGGRLSAKMIELEVSATDLAVSDTSLFAIFADGRAALYDGAALAGAGEGALGPTATLRLGARGEPTTMALTGRASPTLWVGTGAGEVLQVGVVKKGAV